MNRPVPTLFALLLAVGTASAGPPAGVAPPSPGYVWVDAPGVGSFGGYWTPQPATTPLIPAVSAGPVAAVRVRDAKCGASGSGTVVLAQKGRSLVLTAKHAAPDDGDHYEVLVGKRVHKAKRLFAAADDDLALLEVAADLGSAVPPAAVEPPGQTAVRTYGFPGGVRTPKAGSVIDPVSVRGRPMYRLALTATPGDSGSAVLDPTGSLAAVVVERDLKEPISYAVALPVVRKFLRETCKLPLPEYAVYRFTAEHRCPPCRAFAPVWRGWEKDHADAGTAFVTVECDQDQTLTRLFRVESIPAVVVVRDGVECGRMGGDTLTEENLKTLFGK